ncbi:MAG: multiple sugar transport system permease protein [Gaiellales bacterium]|jgi:multiple sugar transport system permease protein|nr:multiple sugar transport system permease protein [Gaiellales bacterium]
MTSVPVPAARRRAEKRTGLGAVRWPRVGLHIFLITAAVIWLAPVAWAVFTSFRPYADTAKYGYVSIPHTLSLSNYRHAWTEGAIAQHFRNSMIITLPAIILILLFASSVAFVVSRFSFWFNVPLLVFFMAANLLPQQVIITPLYELYLRIPLPTWLSESGLAYDSYVGLIAINVAFQTGFCTFVLSNYMKTIPKELDEAARVDGAGVLRQFFGIILPLCKPALAALATLEFTWIYNDFLWAVVLMSSGDKQPITSSLANLQGVFFTDNNLIAAASVLVALPTLLVYAIMQRQFIGGLTLGANKG